MNIKKSSVKEKKINTKIKLFLLIIFGLTFLFFNCSEKGRWDLILEQKNLEGFTSSIDHEIITNIGDTSYRKASITWNSPETGSYMIRIGGTNCTSDKGIESNGSNAQGLITANSSIISTILASDLKENNTKLVRICLQVESNLSTWAMIEKTISLDNYAPVISVSPEGGAFENAFNITISCVDELSSCSNIAYTINGDEPDFTTLVSGQQTISGSSSIINFSDEKNYTVKIIAKDNLGVSSLSITKMYSLSSSGFVYLGTEFGLGRGVGKVPTEFINLVPGINQNDVFVDETTEYIYTGTNDGLYISTDGGTNWTYRSKANNSLGGQKVSHVYSADGYIYAAVSSVVFNGSGNPEYTYVGLSISSDLGKTFITKTMADGLASNEIRDIKAIDGKLYIATSAGISYSTDNGETYTTWNKANNGLSEDQTYDIYISGSEIWVASGGGTDLSTNGGTSFVTKRGGPDPKAIIKCHNKLYVGDEDGLHVSSDNGGNFTNEIGSIDEPIGLSCYNDVLYIIADGDGKVYKTSDASTFTVGNNDTTFYKPPTALTFVNNKLYLACGDGLKISSDFQNFTTKVTGNGLPSLMVQNITSVKFNGTNILYVATNDGLGISSDGGTSFSIINTDNSNMTTNTIYTVEASLYDSKNYVFTGLYTKGVGVSNNGGATLLQKDLFDGIDNSYDNHINDIFSIDRGEAGLTIYAATWDGLFRSTDSGSTFSKWKFGGQYIYSIFDTVSKIYTGAWTHGLRYSTDNGNNWTSSSGEATENIYRTYVLENEGTAGADLVFASPVHSDSGYVVGDGLSISTDGATNFITKTTADGLLTNSVYGIYAHKDGSTKYVYAACRGGGVFGGSGGLSISEDGGNSFTNNVSAGLASSSVTSVIYVK